MHLGNNRVDHDIVLDGTQSRVCHNSLCVDQECLGNNTVSIECAELSVLKTDYRELYVVLCDEAPCRPDTVGRDFQNLHSAVVIQFGGDLLPRRQRSPAMCADRLPPSKGRTIQ